MSGVLVSSADFYHSSKFDFITFKHTKSCSKKLTNFNSHAHSAYEILYIVQGSPTYGFEENSLSLKSGDILITPPQQYHFLQVAPNDTYERIGLLLFPKALNLDVELDKVILLSDNHKILRRLIKDFCFYYEHSANDEQREIFEIKTRELLFVLNHLLPNDDVLANSTVNSTLKNVLDYINANLRTSLTVADISKHCFLSEGHIHHLFSNKLNTSPMHYIKTKKMLLAQSLISETDTKQAITTIAQELGFDDYSVFYRNYVKFFHRKPSDDLRKD